MTTPTAPHGPLPELEDLQALLDRLFAPWVNALRMKVTDVHPDGLTLRLPVKAHTVHSGGVLCGQAMMAAADTAMVLAISSKLGGFQPMTTVQMQTSFLRPIPAAAEAVWLRATVLKAGRQLVFGQIDLVLANGSLAAQATSTCALL